MLQGNISRVEDATRCIEPCEACGKDVVNGGGYAFEQCGCPEGKAMEKAMMDEWTLPARVRIAQEDDARQASLDRVAAFNAGYEAARADMPTGTPADAAMDAGERPLTLADFTREVSLIGAERLPSAFTRSDGATLLYQGVANTLYGEPSTGKSWIALMAAIEQIRAGGQVLWWDAEEQPTTLARRLSLLRATDLIGHPSLLWATGDLNKHPTASDEALMFLSAGERAGLVVIDSATSFGCPKDGADVSRWIADHVKPWTNAGQTTLLLDHVPKRAKDRPAGAVGSFEKLSDIRGAALYAHGTAWNGQQGGAIHLTIHKDAHGQLPAPKFSTVSTITAEWDGPTLDWTIGLPNTKSEGEDVQDALLEALESAGAEGVKGSRGVRDLLHGKSVKDIDLAREELLQAGMIDREKVGRAWVYRAAGTE